MEFDIKAFANILKTLCNCYESATEFAKLTGVDRTYLTKYVNEKLKRPPSPKILRKIADNSGGLFTYLELMYICGYFTKDEYNVLKKEDKMRNPERIPEVIKELEEFWKRNPDWRLGQVMSNLSYELMANNDPFYLEDDKLLELLKVYNKNN